MNNIDTGDHVVCIDGKFHPAIAALFVMLPAEGKTYVVRDVRMGQEPLSRQGEISLLLVGLINPPTEGRSRLERGFNVNRFRKLEEQNEKATETRTEVIADKVMFEEVKEA